MIIERKPPRYPRRGPSCLLVIFVIFGIAVSLYVIQNAEEVRNAIVPTPTAEPTRSATEFAVLAELSRHDGANDEAIAFYDQAIQSDPSNPRFYIQVIDLLVRENESERAVERAEQATVLDPENAEVLPTLPPLPTGAAKARRGNPNAGAPDPSELADAK